MVVLRSCIRSFSTSSRSTAAIAFDIDGVLLRGRYVLPTAAKALSLITPSTHNGAATHPLPFICLTNGGGVLESAKAQQLTRLLGIRIDESAVCLSHTPMRALTEQYAKQRVLAVGMTDVKSVAQHYGFTDVITPKELASQYPALVPHVDEAARAAAECKPQTQQQTAKANTPITESSSSSSSSSVPLSELQRIGAVLVMHDPIDWYRDIQILMDVLTAKSPPPIVYFSNPDFVFSGHHWAPRLAQGAFATALNAVYTEWTGQPLRSQRFGKPTVKQYRYAERMLITRAQELGYNDIHHYYMIGDNPSADMRGAHAAGEQWSGILVRTGTIALSKDERDQPDHTCDDVYAAVQWILEQEARRR